MSESADFILHGAQIIDGTGEPAYLSDVAIGGGLIIEIAPDLDKTSAEVIDLTGTVLAPGFIDTHTHDDFAVLQYPEMGFKVQGGVTTVIVGNCGIGAAPFRQAMTTAASFHPNAEFSEWEGYGGYLDRVDEVGPSLNVATLIGHGTIRAAAMGGKERASNPEELAKMKAIIREGMEAGCIGLSSGLQYVPGTYADPEELVELASVVSEADGIYTSHMRSEGDGLIESIEETIEVGRKADLPVVISHLKATGEDNWGRVDQALKLIAQARQEGLTVNADQYPYTAGSTVLSALVHEDAFATNNGGFGLIPPEHVTIASSDVLSSTVGKTIEQLAAELDKSAAETAAYIVEIDPLATCILYRMSEHDVQTIIADPDVMIGSDGLPTMEGQPHPRLYATFARILGHYCRELGLIDLPAAIHKMTGKPAQVFGLVDRGTIRVGAVADLTAFDPDAIIDTATYEDPHQYPPGVSLVMVNGEVVVQDGIHTGARPGKALRLNAP